MERLRYSMDSIPKGSFLFLAKAENQMSGPHPDLLLLFAFCVGMFVGVLGRKIFDLFR